MSPCIYSGRHGLLVFSQRKARGLTTVLQLMGIDLYFVEVDRKRGPRIRLVNGSDKWSF